MNLSAASGSNFRTRGTSFVFNAPALEWTDRAAQAVGTEYTNLSLGGVVSGPISYNKSFFSLSYQFGRNSRDNATLLNTNALGLLTAGVAYDSVQHLLGILSQRGLSPTAGGLHQSRLSDNGSVFGSVTYSPPTSSSGQSIGVTYNANWSRQDPAGGSATSLASASGERTNWGGGLQARHTVYIGNTLSETQAAASSRATMAHRSCAARRQRARELRPPRRRERRLEPDLWRRPGVRLHVRVAERRPSKHAVLVRRREQASAQVGDGAQLQRLRRQPIVQPARDVQLQFALGSRERRAGVVLRAASRRTTGRSTCSSPARRSATRTGAIRIFRFSTACASTAPTTRRRPSTIPTSIGCSGCATTTSRIPSRSVRASDSRRRSVRRRRSSRSPAHSAPRARSCEGASACSRTIRASVSSPPRWTTQDWRLARSRSRASDPRRRFRTGRRTRTTRAPFPRPVPTELSERRSRRQRRTCISSRPTIRTPRSVRANASWNGSLLDGRFSAGHHGHVLAQPEPAALVRPQLQTLGAVLARRRPPGFRAGGEHRSHHGLDRARRRARYTAYTHVYETRSDLQSRSSQIQLSLVSDSARTDKVHLVRDLYVSAHARAGLRFPEHGGRIRSTSFGRPMARGRTRSATTSATISSTRRRSLGTGRFGRETISHL